MKDNLYLITVKYGNGNTELLHIQASHISYAITLANKYFDDAITPGTSYDILAVEHVGKIAMIQPNYSLTA